MTHNPVPLWRRAAAEAIGTGALVAVVVGSGIMAAQLSPGDVGMQLLENSTATALGLAVIIAIFITVSGAHLNPAVSLAVWLLGRRSRTGLPGRDLLAYVTAQIAGGIGGVILANLMFALPAISASQTDRDARHLWLGEIVATAGLITVIFALVRTGRPGLIPPAVGAYIGAAYWFTSSTSFANPAVTIARALTNTFTGIAPSSVPAFIAAQLVGTGIGICLILLLYPAPSDAPIPPD